MPRNGGPVAGLVELEVLGVVGLLLLLLLLLGVVLGHGRPRVGSWRRQGWSASGIFRVVRCASEGSCIGTGIAGMVEALQLLGETCSESRDACRAEVSWRYMFGFLLSSNKEFHTHIGMISKPVNIARMP